MFNKRDGTIKKPRVVEIDFIRGVLILFMIVDHIFFDFLGIMPRIFEYDPKSIIDQLYHVASWYWSWPVRIGFRFFVLAMFFLISGISCSFSKNNLKRGIIVSAVGILISVGFYVGGLIMKEDMHVFFGAISCFGLSILIYWLFKFIFIKVCPNNKEDFKWFALCVGLIIAAIGIGMFDVWNMSRPGPQSEELSWKTFAKIIIGRYQDSGSSDWLPLFPYLGFMFIGSFFGETIYKDRKSLLPKLPSKPDEHANGIKKISYYGIVFPYKGINAAITFTGRHSLWFYLLHQVVLIVVIALIFMAMGFKLNLGL